MLYIIQKADLKNQEPYHEKLTQDPYTEKWFIAEPAIKEHS